MPDIKSQKRIELKNEIISYLKSVGVEKPEIVDKALEKIRNAAFQSYSLDREIFKEKQIREYANFVGKKEGDEFYLDLCWNFAPRHYTTLAGFVMRYEEILTAEMEAEQKLEEKINEQIFLDPLDDYDELGCPDFAVCVYDDRIEVRAYTTGVGEILPKKGRKYIGNVDDVRWQFPLSALAELERLGRPVVKAFELQ